MFYAWTVWFLKQYLSTQSKKKKKKEKKRVNVDWKTKKEKKKPSILQEKLALHTGISAFDVSILE